MALPAPLLPTLLLPRIDHQSLMIHRRKLVVRPINVSDWIFDIPANPFVRHLIKVLKGSAAIAGQSCPQSGLNRVLSSLWVTCSLLPHLLLSLLSHFHPSLLCKCSTQSGLLVVGRTAWPSGRGLPSLAACLRGSGPQDLAQVPGWQSPACTRPSSWAVTGHWSPSRSHSSSWGLGSGKRPYWTSWFTSLLSHSWAGFVTLPSSYP